MSLVFIVGVDLGAVIVFTLMVVVGVDIGGVIAVLLLVAVKSELRCNFIHFVYGLVVSCVVNGLVYGCTDVHVHIYIRIYSENVSKYGHHICVCILSVIEPYFHNCA